MRTKDLYSIERPDFYDEQAQSPNPLRRWFHTTRHLNVRLLVDTYVQPGKLVADLGCGNVVWNSDGQHQVVGVDVNPDALEHTRSKGRISWGVPSLIEDIELPSETVDAVVCSEVLEHIQDFPKVIQEAYRILIPGGFFITTVPYDTFVSMWRPLFWVQCMYQGYINHDEYYKQRCGHINHFSPDVLLSHMTTNGFELTDQFDMKRFTIFTVVRKPQA